MIALRDAYDNPIPDARNQSVEAEASLTGPEVIEATVSINSTGQIIVSYQATKAGAYVLLITVDEEDISNPTHQLQVLPAAANASNSYAVQDPNEGISIYFFFLLIFFFLFFSFLAGGVAGNRVQLLVQLVDSYGNLINSDDDSVMVNATLTGPLPSNATIAIPDPTDLENGTFLVEYLVQQSGEYQLDILVDGDPIEGSPFRPRIEPGNQNKHEKFILKLCLLSF
jgi:hypothetical protein